MSVLAAKRRESRFEAIAYSCELHDMLIEFMHRGFGVKDVDQVVRLKYARGHIDNEDFGYFRFLMHNSKMRIDQLCAQLTSNVRAANSIYATSISEYEKRREYQNTAIINCEQMIKELQHIVDVFEVDINKYGRYIQAIDREIDLIKRWRRRDNKIKAYLQGST